MKTKFVLIIASCLLLFGNTAYSDSTKEEIIALKAQVAAMQADVAEIKKMLEEGARAPAAAPAGFSPQVINLGDSPVKGSPDAPVTLVEYSDYECPFCARHARDVMPLIQEEYVDTGKVKFAMREYPLANLHKNATNAAIAAKCAGNQGKYWEMHDIMFANQKELGIDNLKALASSVGIDAGTFNTCLDNKETERQVRGDMASGAKLGARGTPGFFLGLTDPNDPDKVNLTVFIKGAQSIDQFRASIDDLLDSR